MLLMVAVVLLAVLGTVVFYVIAVRRGKSRVQSALYALLLGPFALPLLCIPPAGRRHAGNEKEGPATE